jgi:transcriptional regulator with XRE-family HTH domain
VINMSKPRAKDLELLKEHRDILFTGKNHLLRILRGDLKVFPRSHEYSSLDKFDVEGMSFGQYLSWCMQEKGFLLKELSDSVSISLDELEQILDDSTLPWDIDLVLVQKFCNVLGISKENIMKTIRQHKMDPQLLIKRLPRGASAARTHHTLNRKERAADLFQTDLLIQESRENDKRDSYLKELNNII